MSLFKDILMEDESLFRNEEILDFDYLPKLLPFREDQQEHMAECIKPLFNKRKARNLFIHGVPGIGKTACVQAVFRELQEFTDKIIPCYVNCWRHETTFSILSEIANRLGSMYHRKRSDSAMDAIYRSTRRLNGIALAFDEIDKARDLDFLYKILDLRKISIFMITNKEDFIADLDRRLKSRLSLESLELKPYNRKETEQILRERLDLAFIPNCWDDEVFDLIVKSTFKLKDIRVGLYLMQESGRSAERDASRRIEKKHLDKAKEKFIDEFPIKSSPTTEEEKLILRLIKNNPGITSGELYEKFKKGGGKLSERTLREYMRRLESQNLIKRKLTSKGFRGKSMRYWLDYF
ncbi:hypothetical protein DRP07_02735 [Archaeoglobales archaeon]|nr:MAG: hypothetical protein DRP07_02735 [Archaeoglobales archaeon]